MSEELENEEYYTLSSGLVLQDDELSKRLKKLFELQPENSSVIDRDGYSWDEAGLSEVFIKVYQDTCRYCPQKKSWMSYSNGRWHKDEGSLIVSNKLKEFCSLLKIYLMEMPSGDVKDKYSKFISKTGDRRFRDRIIKDAMDVMPIHSSMFDNKPYLINCLNGTYDLQKDLFRPHA